MRFLGWSPLIQHYLLDPLRDFSNLPSMPVKAVISIIISALVLLCSYVTGAYFVALSMQIEVNPLDWIAINAIVSFVQIFPVTIGGFGVREGAFAVLLSLYGIPFSQAIVFSLTGFILAAILTAFFLLTLDLIESRTCVN
jgi:hypothetical protein